MDKKANTAREDRFIGIRLMAEGVRCEVKGTSIWDPLTDEESTTHPVVILDGSGLRARTLPYSGSRIDFIMDGNDVTISEAGEVLATGKLEPRDPWRDKLMSDGTTVDSAFLGTSLWSDISITGGCYPAESGRGCKFCVLNKMTVQAPAGPRPSTSETLAAAERQIEATVIAIQSGWRGMVLFVGGATPPERRDQWTTDLFEAIMARFHESLDSDTLSEVPICSYVYPPDDLAEMVKWKRSGVNTVLYDCQAMDPAYFKAICPGRGSQKRWFEAQEAAVEVFGEGKCRGTVVAGLEPMAGMLEGIEERVSKGVHIRPNIFYPIPGTPLGGMRPATAEWYMEAFEKTDEIYARYGHTPDL